MMGGAKVKSVLGVLPVNCKITVEIVVEAMVVVTAQYLVRNAAAVASLTILRRCAEAKMCHLFKSLIQNRLTHTS